MKKRLTLLFVIVTFLIVTAPLGAGPKFVEESGIPEGKALVYIYCPKAFYSQPVEATVTANEQHVAVLAQGLYFPYITAPGRIDFSTVERSTRVTLEVEEGHEYFIRIGSGMKRWELMLVHREKAMSELSACRLPDSPAE